MIYCIKIKPKKVQRIIFKMNVCKIGNKPSVIRMEITVHTNKLSTNQETDIPLGYINPYFIGAWM